MFYFCKWLLSINLFQKTFFEFPLKKNQIFITNLILLNDFKIYTLISYKSCPKIWVHLSRKPKNGKFKGGIKAHSVINADKKVPNMIWYASAATNDHVLLSKLELDTNTIYVFDKGYNDYKAFLRFSEGGTGFVTRLKDNAYYEAIEEMDIPDDIHSGVMKDEIIQVTVKIENGKSKKLKLRRVALWDDVTKRVFVYITNLFELRADLIIVLYKIRWQIELLFKQLKQNFPLCYFPGDNENAIKIQIRCALIANLLLNIIMSNYSAVKF